MGSWLDSRDAELGYTRFYESAEFPDVRGIDLVIIMGGPMNVPDETTHPWLVAEKKFVREAIDQGVAVLGVCLGAQLIADVMGARIFPNEFHFRSVFFKRAQFSTPTAQVQLRK